MSESIMGGSVPPLNQTPEKTQLTGYQKQLVQARKYLEGGIQYIENRGSVVVIKKGEELSNLDISQKYREDLCLLGIQEINERKELSNLDISQKYREYLRLLGIQQINDETDFSKVADDDLRMLIKVLRFKLNLKIARKETKKKEGVVTTSKESTEPLTEQQEVVVSQKLKLVLIEMKRRLDGQLMPKKSNLLASFPENDNLNPNYELFIDLGNIAQEAQQISKEIDKIDQSTEKEAQETTKNIE